MTQKTVGPESITDDYQQIAAEQAVATEKLVAEIGISATARVLDIGCGTGNAALAVARRRAVVTGIDIDEQSIERARLRAASEGLAGIDFKVADARQIPFADASFDVVLSTLGLVFLPDQEAAAKELARIVRPGGMIALTAYATQSIPSQIYDLVNGFVNNPHKPARPHYAWSHGPRAGELLNPYFETVRVRYDSFDTCFASSAASFDHVKRWNPNLRNLLARLPDDQAASFRDAYLAILDRHNRATDGSFVANMDYAIITGFRRH